MTTTTDIKTGTRMTLEEFLALPEVEGYCELVDGVVYMAAFPILNHQFLRPRGSRFCTTNRGPGLGIVLQHAGSLSPRRALGPDVFVDTCRNAPAFVGNNRVTAPPTSWSRFVVRPQPRSGDQASLLWRAGVQNTGSWMATPTTSPNWRLDDNGCTRNGAVLTRADTLTTPVVPEPQPALEQYQPPARITPVAGCGSHIPCSGANDHSPLIYWTQCCGPVGHAIK